MQKVTFRHLNVLWSDDVIANRMGPTYEAEHVGCYFVVMSVSGPPSAVLAFFSNIRVGV